MATYRAAAVVETRALHRSNGQTAVDVKTKQIKEAEDSHVHREHGHYDQAQCA
jgi:hypothetical protein